VGDEMGKWKATVYLVKSRAVCAYAEDVETFIV